jgi:hypothetical protein
MLPHEKTIALLAASIPLAPDPARIHAALSVPELDWDDVLYFADGHGVTPLLHTVWRDAAGLALVPSAARARLEQAYHDNAARNADAQREFRELVTRLQALRVETIVLKGLPLVCAQTDLHWCPPNRARS